MVDIVPPDPHTHLVIDNALRPFRWPSGDGRPYAVDTIPRPPDGVSYDHTVYEPHDSFRLRPISDRLAQDLSWEFDPGFGLAEVLVHESSVLFHGAADEVPGRVIQVYYDAWERLWRAEEYDIDRTLLTGADEVLIGQQQWTARPNEIHFSRALRPTGSYVLDGMEGMPVEHLLSLLTVNTVLVGRDGTLAERPPADIPVHLWNLLDRDITPEVYIVVDDHWEEVGFGGLLAHHRQLRTRIAEFDEAIQSPPPRQSLSAVASETLWRDHAARLLDRLERRITSLPAGAPRLSAAGYTFDAPAPSPFSPPTSVPMSRLAQSVLDEAELAKEPEFWAADTRSEPIVGEGSEPIRIRIGEGISLEYSASFRAMREMEHRTTLYVQPDYIEIDWVLRIRYEYDSSTSHGWMAECLRSDLQAPVDPATLFGTADEVDPHSFRWVDGGLPETTASDRLTLDELVDLVDRNVFLPSGEPVIPPEAMELLRQREAALPELVVTVQSAARPAVLLASRARLVESLSAMRQASVTSSTRSPRETAILRENVTFRQDLIEHLNTRIAELPAEIVTPQPPPRPQFEVVGELIAEVDPHGQVQLHQLPTAQAAGAATAALIAAAAPTTPVQTVPDRLDVDQPPPEVPEPHLDQAHELD